MKAVLVGAAAFIAVFAAAPTGQLSADFARLFAEYRGAGADRSVRELSSWPEDRESRESPRLNRDEVATDPWAAAALAAFHLESGLARWGFQSYRPDRPFHLGQSIVELIVAIARDQGDARLLVFCRDWYVAANTIMRQPSGVRAHFELGPNGLESPRRQIGDDPEILTLLGTDRAAYMGPEVLEGSYVRHIFGARTLFDGQWYARPDARDAERYFRKALEINPDFAEARLRLGRVLQIMGDPAAEQELRQAADSKDPVVSYLAHLFRGQGHQIAGRLADAQAAYGAAIGRYPAGTVARLALSQALFQDGDNAAAWSASRSVFAPETMHAARDPWAAFPVYNYWHLDDRFARIRGQVSASPWRGAPVGPPIPRLVHTEPPGHALPGEALSAKSPIFRTRVEAVRVEALVTHDGLAVRDLTARDFVITDNGVPQIPDRVTMTWGLHVALIVDTSRSVWPTQTWRQVEAGAAAVVRALTPDDRLSLLTASERFTLLAHAVPPDLVTPLLGRLNSSEQAEFTALWDAVFAATSLVADAPGRGLVIALSDASDTVSWFDRRATTARLHRLGITVDAVEVDRTLGTVGRQHDWTDHTVGLVDMAPLRGTGGQVFPGHAGNLASRLAERFNELRAGYLLYYTPTKTTPHKDGWHEIKVTLRPGVKGRVQARPGYYAPARK